MPNGDPVGPLAQAAATIAQALVHAGAIRLVAGILVDLLALLAVWVASNLPQWEGLFWVPFGMAVALAIIGTATIGWFFVRGH
jgi:hypothetical protein